jgi:hypothetical protein
MNIWEGWTDTYREVVYHGGIPDTFFWSKLLAPAWGTSTTRIEDLVAEQRDHPLLDALWASKTADFSKIRIPAFIVACWADQGLHLRGTLEGFKKIASEQKWLEIHGRKKWAYYYEPKSKERLRQFFDHFLMGKHTPLEDWPRVRMEVRERYFVGEFRGESEWPLERTKYTRLYLNAQQGVLQEAQVAEEGTFSYSSLASGPGAHRAEFEWTSSSASTSSTPRDSSCPWPTTRSSKTDPSPSVGSGLLIASSTRSARPTSSPFTRTRANRSSHRERWCPWR